MPFPAGTPGSYAVADWVSLEALRLLKNMLEMASYANFTYQDEFKKSFQPGDTIRVKFPQEFRVTDGFAYAAQAINRQTTTVTIDQPMQIAYEWDSIEEALKLERTQAQISDEYVMPAMAQMAQEFETRYMDFAFFNTSNVVGALTHIPTSWDVYAQARQIMVENAGWGAAPKRGIGVTPGMMRTLINNSLTQFNPMDEISQQYKNGSIGRAAGWDWYESMSCHPHTTGHWASLTALRMDGANQTGSVITMHATNGDVWRRGDRFVIEGVYNVNPRTRRSTNSLLRFLVMQTATASGGHVTLNIFPPITGYPSPYQTVSHLPANNAHVTPWPGTPIEEGETVSGMLGLGTNNLAHAMAGIELMMPQEGGVVKLARQRRDPNTGIAVALISMFDGILRRQINRIDSLIGFGRLYGNRCAVLVASSE